MTSAEVYQHYRQLGYEVTTLDAAVRRGLSYWDRAWAAVAVEEGRDPDDPPREPRDGDTVVISRGRVPYSGTYDCWQRGAGRLWRKVRVG